MKTRSEMVDEYVNEKMEKIGQNKKEKFDGCWGCLEFIIDILVICAVIKIVFFM